MIHGRQLLFTSKGSPRVWIEPTVFPSPQGGQVLVQNSHTHVSAGTELNFLRHGPQAYGRGKFTDPGPLGYMSTGRVVAVGPDVRGFAVGDRVAGGGNHASHALHDLDAGAFLNLLPEGVSESEGGFVALGDVALHAIRRARLQIDQSVAVFGTGMVGQLVLQLARISGAHPLLAIDLLDTRLDCALTSGSSHVINATRDDVQSRVLEITGNGAEAVFICADSAAVVQPALECAAERGSVMLTGSLQGTATLCLQSELLRKELTLCGTYEAGLQEPHPYWPWSRRRNRKACLRLMSAGQLRLRHLVSHVVPAEEAPGMYQSLLQGGGPIGLVFQWS